MTHLLASPALGPLSTPTSCRSQCRLPTPRRLVRAAAQQQPGQQRRHTAPAVAAASVAALAAAVSSPGAALAAAAADPQAAAAAQAIYELAGLDSQSAGALSGVLKPVLTLSSMLMIVRIVMSWYPEIDGKALPWSIAYTPTGELSCATRQVRDGGVHGRAALAAHTCGTRLRPPLKTHPWHPCRQPSPLRPSPALGPPSRRAAAGADAQAGAALQRPGRVAHRVGGPAQLPGRDPDGASGHPVPDRPQGHLKATAAAGLGREARVQAAAAGIRGRCQ